MKLPAASHGANSVGFGYDIGPAPSPCLNGGCPMWSNLVFGIVLIGVSLLMTWFQFRARQKLQRDHEILEESEATYLRKRYRRHAITNALIGLTGVAIIGSSWVRTSAEATLIYWGLVMVLVVAIVYSALKDVSATRLYFGELRREQTRQREALQDELKRFHDEQEDNRTT